MGKNSTEMFLKVEKKKSSKLLAVLSDAGIRQREWSKDSKER